jgi:hypothetical protein
MAVSAMVPIHQAPAGVSTARDRLIDAMDVADLLGHEIPCKTEPEAFTSDLLAFNSEESRKQAAGLALKCLGCPVVADCRDYVRETRRNHSVRMFGVVAGYLVLPHTTHQIDPKGDA